MEALSSAISVADASPFLSNSFATSNAPNSRLSNEKRDKVITNGAGMKALVSHLVKIADRIARGDYESGKQFDQLMNDVQRTPEERELIESLNFMAVKLEARELHVRQTIEELQEQNRKLTLANRRNELFSTLFVSVLLSVALYTFLLLLGRALHYESPYSPRIVEIMFVAVNVIVLRKSGFPLAQFGLTLRGSLASLRLMWPGTLLICTLLALVKYVCIQMNVEGLTGGLFKHEAADYLLVAYVPVVFLQEFLMRGVGLTTFSYVLAGRHANFWAVLTTAALFGLFHAHASLTLSLVAFLLSLYWGWLYSKTRTLIGVCLSHLMIGDFAHLLGLWDYLDKLP